MIVSCNRLIIIKTHWLPLKFLYPLYSLVRYSRINGLTEPREFHPGEHSAGKYSNRAVSSAFESFCAWPSLRTAYWCQIARTNDPRGSLRRRYIQWALRILIPDYKPPQSYQKSGSTTSHRRADIRMWKLRIENRDLDWMWVPTIAIRLGSNIINPDIWPILPGTAWNYDLESIGNSRARGWRCGGHSTRIGKRQGLREASVLGQMCTN